MVPVPQRCGLVAARRVGSGLTLLETVLAAAVTGIVMIGLGSAMLIAGRAMPDAKSVAAATLAAAAAAEQIAADLQYAVSVSQRTSTMIEFTVHDRNGDNAPEIIRYSWSGSPGTVLTRQYNGAAAETILADVQAFSLAYTLEIIATETPKLNESAETILASYDSNRNLFDFPIKDGERYAEYFCPVLPVDTVSWKVTRVVLPAKLDGTTGGQASIRLRRSTVGGQVSDVVLEEKPLLESALTSKYTNREFAFSTVSGLAPAPGLWIVAHWLADAIACRIQGQSTGVTATNLSLAKSIDHGSTWSVLAGQSLLFTVYGTVTTAGTPQIQNTYYLERVDLTLRMTSDPAAGVQTGVRLLNRPTVMQ